MAKTCQTCFLFRKNRKNNKETICLATSRKKKAKSVCDITTDRFLEKIDEMVAEVLRRNRLKHKKGGDNYV